ncbi:hypothetical protein CI238_04761 [Colletotrichum incanum]|uniref:Uncharacterized protein n=1 Tax=Colletotrichum incanum TaxID=1573173 RepID=A0A162NUT3_COLIC|nr:hypothetical protein CI238_04761 [Colletotrichum incanum]
MDAENVVDGWLEAHQGTRNLLNGQMPNNWPPPAMINGNLWYPSTPQRHTRGPAHLLAPMTMYSIHQQDWVQTVRILTDVFSALREPYLVDFDGFNAGYDALRKKMHSYLDAPHDDSPRDRCERRHPGKPKSWGGLEETEIVKARFCAARELGIGSRAFDNHRF